MARLKPAEIRRMLPDERLAKLRELRTELMHERGIAAMGGAPPSPGKMRALRRDIARILTILHEEEETQPARGEEAVEQEETK
jgi:large subunit ribosomal protein L29